MERFSSFQLPMSITNFHSLSTNFFFYQLLSVCDMNPFEIQTQDPHSRARTGVIHTAHGDIQTPAYAIVGTHGAVRCVDVGMVRKLQTQVLMVNTYHMWKALGDAGLKQYNGLHAAMHWEHPIMTDSGGFQVFSMGAARVEGVGKIARTPERAGRESLTRVSEDGVHFTVDGEERYLDAETSMSIQAWLAGDMIFAFDECTSPFADRAYTQQSMERTHRWAQRSLDAHDPKQLLYGIIQGGRFRDLREESARVISAMGFDGIAIGGSFGDSFGDSKEATYQELSWVLPHVDASRPRHLLGIGRIDDIILAVEQGIDTFDCVVPTREARHGWLWTRSGVMDITNARYQSDTSVIDPTCLCPICAGDIKTLRCDLRVLFKTKNPQAGEQATVHNVYFFNQLMTDIRQSINEGVFRQFKQRVLAQLRTGVKS